jgi:transcriptional regulator GlxA family with amidase domain
MHITILIPGFGYPSPIIGPYEIFVSAGVLWQNLMGEKEDKVQFKVSTASVDGRPVKFIGGVTIKPDKAIAQIRKTDLIFIPSIGLEVGTVLNKNAAMLNLLNRQADKGTIIAAACTGVAMLAEAGILNGKPATTHWALAEDYQKRYPDVEWKTELFITESDNIVCGGGVYASLDLCLYLVEKFAGYDIAKQTRNALLIDAPRTWQSSFSAPTLNLEHQDEKIKKAQEFLHKHFNKPLSFDELANEVGMSKRNFARRFKQATNDTPLNYLHKLRINCAKYLLETSRKTVQEICYEIGYEDIPFFRNIFKRHSGLSPKSYKQRFAKRQ